MRSLLYILIAIATATQLSAQTVSARFTVRPQPPLYVNQLFTLELEVTSTGVDLGNRMSIDGMPDRRTLVAEPFEELTPQSGQRNGTPFTTRRFSCQLRAPKAVALTIASELGVSIVQRQRTPFGTTRVERPKRLRVAPLGLKILPIPANGRPQGFDGAVGQFNYKVDADQELVALGASNAVSGLFGAFTVDGSLSRTAAADQAGQKSQFASIALALIGDAF